MRLLFICLLLTAACNTTTDDPYQTPPPPPCTTTADCSTGTCLNSRCVADGSVAGGQTCELDQQCRSETCEIDGACEPAEGEPGGPCDAGNACDPGVSCLVNLCVTEGSLTAGMTCSLPEQCASGECLTSPFICAAGGGESCTAAPCANGSTCLVNVCIEDGTIEDGDTCSEDEQCKSGGCDNFTCEPAACNPIAPVGGTAFAGSVDASLPSDAVLVMVWVVTSGNDYEWIFGEAMATGTSLSVNLATLPPPEAVNSYGLAIGVAVAYPVGTVISPGLFVEPNDDMLGATDRHAIVWKAACGTDVNWTGDFNPGYTCGACVPASGNDTFDSYAPTDCSNVMLNLDGPNFDFCNWT